MLKTVKKKSRKQIHDLLKECKCLRKSTQKLFLGRKLAHRDRENSKSMK